MTKHRDSVRWTRWLAVALLSLPVGLWTGGPAISITAQASPQATAALAQSPAARVVRIGMTVSDLDRAVVFYTTVLDFKKISETETSGEYFERLEGVFPARARVARLRLGNEELELTDYLAPQSRAIPEDFRSNDRAFQHIAIVVSDMSQAYQRLRQHKVTHVSAGPQRLPDWNPNAGGIEAFYFKDPDGHVLEAIHFPPGKGDPRWQHPDGGRLFLGIDHTAIVVADTDASLAFYREVLGMRVAGKSENYGPEQERLNGIFGARLRITSLRGAGGPGIEFLEYLSPGNGRPAPADRQASDLAHWQVTLAAPELDRRAELARARGGRWVSPGLIGLEPKESEAASPGQAILVEDPDGHALQLITN